MKSKTILLMAALSLIMSAGAQTPASLQKQITALQAQVTALQQNNALKLAPFVTVNANPENNVPGPNITFHGANVHIVNGLGATQLMNGLGNLIIGYDEFEVPNTLFPAGGRTGSHSVILGKSQCWFGSNTTGNAGTAYGNLMVGEANWTWMAGEFVAGFENQVVGRWASILGGSNNETFAERTVILGGVDNFNQTVLQVMP